MPDVPLAGGGRLYEALRGGRFVLVGEAGSDDIHDVNGWEDRVRVAAPAEPIGHPVLVRPDGYVAKVFDRADPAAPRAALAELTGRPM
jgi:hypothetical protein